MKKHTFVYVHIYSNLHITNTIHNPFFMRPRELTKAANSQLQIWSLSYHGRNVHFRGNPEPLHNIDYEMTLHIIWQWNTTTVRFHVIKVVMSEHVNSSHIPGPFEGNPLATGEFPHIKSQLYGVLMFSLTLAWTSCAHLDKPNVSNSTLKYVQ